MIDESNTAGIKGNNAKVEGDVIVNDRKIIQKGGINWNNIHIDGSATLQLNSDNDKNFSLLNPASIKPVSDWFGFTPNLTPLITALKQQKIIFIGDNTQWKRQIAQLCAKRFIEYSEAKEEDTRLPLFEWREQSDPRGIVSLIEKDCETGIVLLPNLKPNDLSVHFKELVQLAQNQYYFIITTDTPSEEWRFSVPNIQELWHSPSNRELFSAEYRKKHFIQEYQALRRSGDIREDKLSVKVSELAAKSEELITFTRITRYVNEIAQLSYKKSIEKQDVDYIVRNLCENTDEISEWYNQLSLKQQLTAIGLSIFYGSNLDVFFNIMDEAVVNYLREREPELSCFDYEDLLPLHRYFQFSGNSGQEIITSTNNQLPAQILSVAWDSHRRFIHTLLPLSIQVARISSSYQRGKIYTGNRNNQANLRHAIGTTLAFVKSRDNQLFEFLILPLIAIDNYEAHEVVAYALSSIYISQRDTSIFSSLKKWCVNRHYEDRIHSYQKHRDIKTKLNPRSLMQSMVILTLVKILTVEDSHHFPSQCLEIFDKILDSDPSLGVCDRITSHFLPVAFSFHFSETKNYFEKLAVKNTFNREEIARALACAYDIHSEEVLKILERSFYESEIAKDSNKSRITYRVKILACCLRTLGFINFDRNPQLLNLESATQKIHKILNKEHHPVARFAALQTIVEISENNFEEVGSDFQSLLDSLSEEEYKTIVEQVTQVYIAQRRDRRDGDISLYFNDAYYAVWVDQKRPQMPIEILMHSWLKEVKTQAAARIAYRALHMMFETFDKPEKEAIAAHREEQRNLQEKAKLTNEQKIIQLERPKHVLSLYSKFVSIPIGIPKKYRQTTKSCIAAVLPEALTQTQEQQFESIEKLSPSENYAIAESLRRVLFWERYKKPVLVGGAIMLLFFMSMF